MCVHTLILQMVCETEILIDAFFSFFLLFLRRGVIFFFIAMLDYIFKYVRLASKV